MQIQATRARLRDTFEAVCLLVPGMRHILYHRVDRVVDFRQRLGQIGSRELTSQGTSIINNTVK